MSDAEPLLEFAAVMRRLRAECPWKRAQTHESLVRYLVEELHETIEAIETGTPDDLREELGDLLLQVYFHAVIAEEDDAFTLDDVARGIVEKMVRRNPHVFGGQAGPVGEDDGGELAVGEVNELWESVKAREKQRSSVLDGLPPALPGLLHADKLVDRLGRAGHEVRAAADDDDLGERLLALVVEAHDAGVDPEQALRRAVRRRVDAAEGGGSA